MKIGIIGLGKMGLNIRDRINNSNTEHQAIGYDINSSVSDVESLEQLIKNISQPKYVLIMVAHTIVQSVIDELETYLSYGDYIIDGGNSYYKDSINRYKYFSKLGISFLDVGFSGGIHGKENGYGMMVGGDKKVFDSLKDIFNILKPKGENGLVYAGKSGSGHFVKMIHNGIEYGIMQSYAEGYALIESNDLIDNDNIINVFNSWRDGSVIRSWLLDLLAKGLKNSNLEEIEGYIEDSGEGKWTVQESLDNSVPIPIISSALYTRFSSRNNDEISNKIVAILRNQFGGHSIHNKE